MSSYGHVFEMIRRLKANRELLGKRKRVFDHKDIYYQYRQRARLEFPKATPEERARLRRQIRRDVRLDILLRVFSVLIAFAILFLLTRRLIQFLLG